MLRGSRPEIGWDQVKMIIGREPTEAEKGFLTELRNAVHKRHLTASLISTGDGAGEMAAAHCYSGKLSFSDEEIADGAAQAAVRLICGGMEPGTVSLHCRAPRPEVRGARATIQRVKKFGRQSNCSVSISFTDSEESALLTAFSGSVNNYDVNQRPVRDGDVIIQFSADSVEKAMKPFTAELAASPDGHRIVSVDSTTPAVAVAVLCHSVGKGAALQKSGLTKKSTADCIAVVRKKRESSVKGKARKHKVSATTIGTVSDIGFFSVKGSEISLPLSSLGIFEHEEALPSALSLPADLAAAGSSSHEQFKEPKSFNSELLKLLAADECVEASRTNPAKGESFIETADGDVIAEFDPRRGAQEAFASAARKVIGHGASPKIASVAVTLPETPDDGDYYRFGEFSEGLSAASAALQLPVATAHVSFDRECVQPRLTVAVSGSVENGSSRISRGFQNADDFILMLGSHRGELGCSVYGRLKSGENIDPAPMVDLVMERQIREIVLVGNRIGLINSATHISSGGLATAIAHAIIRGGEGIGARIHLSSKIRNDQLLFGETRGLIVISVSEESIIEIERLCMNSGVPCTAIGRVTSDGRYTFNDLIKLKREKMVVGR